MILRLYLLSAPPHWTQRPLKIFASWRMSSLPPSWPPPPPPALIGIQCSLGFCLHHLLFLTNLLHSHGLKYHPSDDDSEIFISGPTCSSDCQIPIPVAFCDVPLEVTIQPTLSPSGIITDLSSKPASFPAFPMPVVSSKPTLLESPRGFPLPHPLTHSLVKPTV